MKKSSGFKMKSSPTKFLNFNFGSGDQDNSRTKIKNKRTGNKRFSLFGSIFGRGRGN